MKPRQMTKLGIPAGRLARDAVWTVRQAQAQGMDRATALQKIADLARDPAAFTSDPLFGPLARALLSRRQHAAPANHTTPQTSSAPSSESSEPPSLPHQTPTTALPRTEPVPWKLWTAPGIEIDPQAIQQIENACRLPVAVRGALMPDAHVGYGLPIGGVLAVDNAVIPYGVGVDIACRMKLSVLDLPPDMLEKHPDRLIQALEKETLFGVGAEFPPSRRRQHPVMDMDWSVSPITRQNKDKAWAQLGTSGSGNHFVEFGRFVLDHDDLGLPAGTYLAILTHSGSRGTGALVADHYSRLARKLHPQLPRHLAHLAWLDLDKAEGQEYWAAMQLMGQYAAANHACIHQALARHLGARVILDIENHHNFAWLETHDGRTVVVHRKGATPAGPGVLGIIPGSMASPAYIVRGLGNPESLHSAAHGAGRVISRAAAKKKYRWQDVQHFLRQKGVRVLSAGVDEVPFVYKDINLVMSAQSDLVEIVARFHPVLVKMAPEGEQPED